MGWSSSAVRRLPRWSLLYVGTSECSGFMDEIVTQVWSWPAISVMGRSRIRHVAPRALQDDLSRLRSRSVGSLSYGDDAWELPVCCRIAVTALKRCVLGNTFCAALTSGQMRPPLGRPRLTDGTSLDLPETKLRPRSSLLCCSNSENAVTLSCRRPYAATIISSVRASSRPMPI